MNAIIIANEDEFVLQSWILLIEVTDLRTAENKAPGVAQLAELLH
jgi:hypothetical protein